MSKKATKHPYIIPETVQENVNGNLMDWCDQRMVVWNRTVFQFKQVQRVDPTLRRVFHHKSDGERWHREREKTAGKVNKGKREQRVREGGGHTPATAAFFSSSRELRPRSDFVCRLSAGATSSTSAPLVHKRAAGNISRRLRRVLFMSAGLWD